MKIISAYKAGSWMFMTVGALVTLTSIGGALHPAFITPGLGMFMSGAWGLVGINLSRYSINQVIADEPDKKDS